MKKQERMKWTKEKPTKQGWYWFNPYDCNHGFPNKIMIFYIDLELDVWIDHRDSEFWCIRDFKGEWAGPIEEPKECEK